MRITIFSMVFLAFILFFWKNLVIPKSTGIYKGNLHACPNSPNCVSSQSKDTKHYVKPLVNASENSLYEIKTYLIKHYKTDIVEETPIYLHVVITSKIFKFKDDLEFLLDQKNRVIQIRSASRIGYSDMNVNRKRIEKMQRVINSY